MMLDVQNSTKEDILHYLVRHQLTLKSFGVHKLGLFGSFVRNEQREDSDMDFLVEFSSGNKHLANFFGLIDWLEQAFGREVELVTVDSLSPHIGPYIEREVAYVSLSA